MLCGTIPFWSLRAIWRYDGRVPTSEGDIEQGWTPHYAELREVSRETIIGALEAAVWSTGGTLIDELSRKLVRDEQSTYTSAQRILSTRLTSICARGQGWQWLEGHKNTFRTWDAQELVTLSW